MQVFVIHYNFPCLFDCALVGGATLIFLGGSNLRHFRHDNK